jgi:20S proteasome alpha/beta subunit
MTLIVALGCTDGIVMGADSASTDIVSGTKQPVIKIQQVGKHPILCGCSGDGGLIQKIHEDLDGMSLTLSGKFKNTRQAIKRVVIQEMKDARDTHVAQPLQGFNTPPTATLLFGCIQNRLPFILEIEVDGRDTLYDHTYGWFNAVGSGKPWAQAIMRSHLAAERDLNLGKILAYRVLEDSIELAAEGLAKPIHLYTLDLDGKITKLGEDELKKLSENCELWRELERESLGRLLAPSLAVEQEIEVPEPEIK